mmetsp:Transcript_10875/g.17940  ORF Transcript_10875/g.17940 Transcript_10875/m.17940 type:complete len:247 (+) Transcript_10875:494-1234(+)
MRVSFLAYESERNSKCDNCESIGGSVEKLMEFEPQGAFEQRTIDCRIDRSWSKQSPCNECANTMSKPCAHIRSTDCLSCPACNVNFNRRSVLPMVSNIRDTISSVSPEHIDFPRGDGDLVWFNQWLCEFHHSLSIYYFYTCIGKSLFLGWHDFNETLIQAIFLRGTIVRSSKNTIRTSHPFILTECNTQPSLSIISRLHRDGSICFINLVLEGVSISQGRFTEINRAVLVILDNSSSWGRCNFRWG